MESVLIKYKFCLSTINYKHENQIFKIQRLIIFSEIKVFLCKHTIFSFLNLSDYFVNFVPIFRCFRAVS